MRHSQSATATAAHRRRRRRQQQQQKSALKDIKQCQWKCSRIKIYRCSVVVPQSLSTRFCRHRRRHLHRMLCCSTYSFTLTSGFDAVIVFLLLHIQFSRSFARPLPNSTCGAVWREKNIPKYFLFDSRCGPFCTALDLLGDPHKNGTELELLYAVVLHEDQRKRSKKAKKTVSPCYCVRDVCISAWAPRVWTELGHISVLYYFLFFCFHFFFL